MRATAFIAFSINKLPYLLGGMEMKKSYWNTWLGFLTQMVSFAVLGVLIALAVKNLQDLLGG
jgi:hypothetical protein